LLVHFGIKLVSIPISYKKRDGFFDQPLYFPANVIVKVSLVRVIATKQFRRSSCISWLPSPFFLPWNEGSSSSAIPTKNTCENSIPLDAWIVKHLTADERGSDDLFAKAIS